MATIRRQRRQLPNRNMYTVKLNGAKITVTVTSTASVVRKWIKSMLHFNRRRYRQWRLVVGLGVQWTPGVAHPPPDTLTLCTNRRCLIFHLTHAAAHVPGILRQILLDEKICFVGIWNQTDRAHLAASRHHLQMFRFPYDMRDCLEMAYADPGLDNASVRWIVKKYLGFTVDQSLEVRYSDWNRVNLSDDQVSYACVDAHCAYLIGRKIWIWNLD